MPGRRLLLCLALLACTRAAQLPSAPERPVIDVAGMDPAVAPGDDFFLYANGGWIKSTEIPADRSSWGPTSALEELTSMRVADLIAEAARSEAAAGSEARKIGDFYASYMDEAAIETRGLAPLEPALERIAAVSDAQGLARVLGGTLRADVDVLNNTILDTDNLFGLWVAQDLNDPSRYSPFLLQGGLGLTDRDYYLDPAQRMADIRTKYQAHIAAVLKLAGIAGGEEKARRIFELERRIAQVHAPRVDTEDVLKGNNHWAREDFPKRAPGLDWQAYFAAAGLDGQKEFVAWHPGAIAGIAALVREQPLEVWKEYLTFRALEHQAEFLPRSFVEEDFAFHQKVLFGTPKMRDRWKRAVRATSAVLGEAVGKLYVARYFPAAEKARAEEMVRNIVAAFGRRIDALTWMTPQTKARAKAKLAVLIVGVGYPDKWRDYSELEIVRDDAFGNAARYSLFNYRQKVARLGQPVDRSEWVMNPQLVNAVNLPALNALNFPAAILQPPLFDPSRPAVMDYGATGAVIGHEISHSFDDSGALFDEKGRLDNWWTDADFAHFKASSEQLAKQFDGYRPFPDLAVNGKLTSGENIADVAGLAAAFDAYRLSQGGKEAPSIEGFTGDQQFFISFAQGWRRKFREPLLRQLIVIDGHAPSQYRALTVRNLDAWYEAFAVKPGQALFLAPPERVHIW